MLRRMLRIFSATVLNERSRARRKVHGLRFSTLLRIQAAAERGSPLFGGVGFEVRGAVAAPLMVWPRAPVPREGGDRPRVPGSGSGSRTLALPQGGRPARGGWGVRARSRRGGCGRGPPRGMPMPVYEYSYTQDSTLETQRATFSSTDTVCECVQSVDRSLVRVCVHTRTHTSRT